MTDRLRLSYVLARGWTARAACLGQDTDGWFPDDLDTLDTALAVAVCETCAVCQVCLAYALLGQEAEGIWGGLTPAERSALRAVTDAQVAA